jgi:hypothetical protein
MGQFSSFNTSECTQPGEPFAWVLLDLIIRTFVEAQSNGPKKMGPKFNIC